MTMMETAATAPAPLSWWLNWLGLVLVAAPLLMLALRGSRREGAVALGVIALTWVIVEAMHGRFGYVRLLGLPHLILWTPLIWWLARRRGGMKPLARAAATVFIVTVALCLVIDATDTARWIAGDRAPTLPPGQMPGQ